MRLVPYHRFEITSPMKREDALGAISSRLEERQWFRWRWPSADNDERFDGAVTQSGFSITRIMGYRNSFAPVIEGEVHATGGFSRIVITMRPSIFVLVFLDFFALIFLSVFLRVSETTAAGVAMLALLYVVVMGGFWFEANKLEQTLRRIFKAM